MTACVIMHNMIVEDKHDDIVFDQGWGFQGENVEPEYGAAMFAHFTQFHQDIRGWTTHHLTSKYLVEHMWTRVGNQQVYRLCFYNIVGTILNSFGCNKL